MLDKDCGRREVSDTYLWSTAKEKLTKEEVRPRSGEWYEEARNTRFGNGVKITGRSKRQEITCFGHGVKIAGQDMSLLVQRVQPAAKARHVGRFDRGGRNEAAAKNDSYEGFEKEHQGKRWVSELLAAHCEKGVAPCWMGRYDAEIV